MADEAAIVAPNMAPLTAAEKKDADKLWEEKIEAFRKSDTSTLEAVYMNIWNKGVFVQELLGAPRKYGNHSVEQLAQELSQSEELLYSYRRLVDSLTWGDVQDKIQKKIAWHSLYYLITIKDKKTRDAVEKKFLEQKWTAAQLQAEVKEVNQEARKDAKAKGKKVDGRGGVTPNKAMRSMANLAWEVDKALDEMPEMMKEIFKIEDPERLKDALHNKKDAKEALMALRKKIDKALEQIDKDETLAAKTKK